MKKILVLFLVIFTSNVFSDNTIIAVVNTSPILINSLQDELLEGNSNEERIDILNAQIDVSLQMQKVDQLNLHPSEEDLNKVLQNIATKNNLSINDLLNFEKIDDIKKEVFTKLSILNLQRHITKDISVPSDKIFNHCSNNNFNKDQKQIKIAQIIVSEIDSEKKDPKQKNTLVKSFLDKLSKHISKGASFHAFAKLHSQHPSYKDGGISEWVTVNNPTLEMLDSLKENEVSEIYSTSYGLAIAIKINERFISSKLKACEEQIIFENAEKYYSEWLKSLRNEAFIEIYYDKLI